MEFKKYKPAIDVQDNGTTNVFNGTLTKGTASVKEYSPYKNYDEYIRWYREKYHILGIVDCASYGNIRNASRVLINNKPVTGWVYSTDYAVYGHISYPNNNNGGGN